MRSFLLIMALAQSLARVDALLADRMTLRLAEGTTYFQEGVDGCVCRLPMRGGGLVSVQSKGSPCHRLERAQQRLT